MTLQASVVAARPRARRNRMALVVTTAIIAGATAFISGTMLASSGPRPVLMAVGGFESAPARSVEAATEESATVALAALAEHEPAADPMDVAVEQAGEIDEDIRWFNNRPIRPAATMSMLVTAYSPDEQSCGEWADGITASGFSVWTNGMKLVAADTRVLPFGSLISIPGYDNGAVVPVLDRGGAIKGNRLDVLYPTHERALEWGVQRLEVTVWEYADGQPNGFREDHRPR